jgi:hypothetical protein
MQRTCSTRGFAREGSPKVANHCRENAEKRPENSDSNVKSGLGKQDTVPDRTQKNKPKSRQ